MNYDVAKIFSALILPEKKIRIKLLGDSITHGSGGTGWEQNGEAIVDEFKRSPASYCWANLMRDYLEGQFNCEVINNGCSGTTIEFIIDKFQDLVSENDDIIVCTIGTNNRHQCFVDGPIKTKTVLAKAFYENILKLNELLKATGKKYVFVINVPAAADNETKGDYYWRILHMNDIHDLYVKAQASCGFPMIDLYTEFLTHCDLKGINFETLLADGLHPNDAGYDVMFKLLLREFGIAEKKHNEDIYTYKD